MTSITMDVGRDLVGQPNLPYKIYALLMILLQCSFPVLLTIDFLRNDKDVLLENFVTTLAVYITLFKSTVLYKHRKKLVPVMMKLEQPPFIPDINRGGPEEEIIFNQCVKITTIQSFGYWIATCMTTILILLVPAIKKYYHPDSYVLPFGLFNFVDLTNNANYWLVFTYQAVTISTVGVLYITTDLIFATILAHISYQFKILQKHFQNTVNFCCKRMRKNSNAQQMHLEDIDSHAVPWKYLKKSLVEGIRHHVALLNIAEEMEEALNMVLLVIFLGTLLLIGVSLYTASSTEENQTAITSLLQAFCSAFQVFLANYWGEQIITESQNVAAGIYNSEFVGTDLRFQKMMSLIIIRSQRATVISTGKFTHIGLHTFAWILRTSYSAFMIMRRTINAKN